MLPDLAYKEPPRIRSKNNKELISLLNSLDNDKSEDLIENLLFAKESLESKTIPQYSKSNSKNKNKPKNQNLPKTTENVKTSTNPFIDKTDGSISDNNIRKLVCWNCDEQDHRFDECTKPRTKFCFRCGKNVIRPECPKCSETE